MVVAERELKDILLMRIFIANGDERYLPSFLNIGYFSTGELDPFQIIKLLLSSGLLEEKLKLANLDPGKYCRFLSELAEADIDVQNVTVEGLEDKGVERGAADSFVDFRERLLCP